MAHPDEPTPYVPSELDTTEDRMGSVHELDFSDRADLHGGRIGDEDPAPYTEAGQDPDRVAESGMTGGETLTDSLHEDGVTLDDMSPDTLLDETGARDPHEPGEGGPADQELRYVDEDEIGGGFGLDEAELARSAPLDGEPWTDDVIDDIDDSERN